MAMGSDGSVNLIRGGTIYDGSGREPFRADIAIDHGVITEVGVNLRSKTSTTIDATGLAVAPGFIDMHSHADFTLPSFPDAVNSISQGVTTEVVGNCGWSPAPLSDVNELRAEWLGISQSFGPDLKWNWSTFAEYLAVLDHAHPAVNCAPLVGHGALRSAVLGMSDRSLTDDELLRVRSLLGDAISAGAWGMSTGLVYPPSSYATGDEIHSLAEDLQARDCMYASHIRDEGDDVVSAVAEALDTAIATGVTTQISHLKAIGVQNRGRVLEALNLISGAQAVAAIVSWDAYPYEAGSTALTQLLPLWAQEGGVHALLRRLRSEELRDRIRAEIRKDSASYLAAAGGWDQIYVGGLANQELRRYEGKSVADLARSRQTDPVSFVFDLLVADNASTMMILFLTARADVEAVFSNPATIVGSDQLRVISRDSHVHPRAYGSFARVLAGFAQRANNDLALSVRRMSELPARILGMTTRGNLHPGFIADIVVFDPASVRDLATYENPTALAAGVQHVLLAGRRAITDGRFRDLTLGRVLRKARGHVRHL